MAKAKAKKKTTVAKKKVAKTAAKKTATMNTSSKKVVDRSADVDAYINKASSFAKPILMKIRAAHKKASPKIVETIKWGVPHFDYNGIVSGMAAFKNHVSFGFWKSRLMKDPANLFTEEPNASMCQTKIADENDLPAEKVLVSYIKEAMALNEADAVAEQSVERKKKKKAPAKAIAVPPDLAALLKKPENKVARDTFENFPPSHKKEYVEWIIEAKREETRSKRVATTIEWLNEGKPKNWKYMNC